MSPSRRLLLVTSLAVCALSSLDAHAKGDAAGDLGTGGGARGDISKTPGETDRLTVTLDEGAALSLRVVASFAPRIVVTGPDGAAVDVGEPSGRRLRVHGRPVTASGAYQIAISSLDGSQGTYALAVSETWARTVPISGTGAAVVDVPMPAGGKIACVVRGGAAILSLDDPHDANLLAASIEPHGSTAKLAPTPTASAGVYHLALGGTGRWSGRVTRVVPPGRHTQLALANGLDTISFAKDGVQRVFLDHCASCHGWAASYGGVRGYINRAIGRIQSGSMPPSGPLSPTEIALVSQWIKTGSKP